jgi:phospholipid N-methyltransferase
MNYEDRQTLDPAWLAAEPESARARWRRRVVFMRNFFKHPRMVGSLLQSSRHLVGQIADQIDFGRARDIVEYGPGVGTITTELLRRMAMNARLLAIESNDEFVELLREAVPDRRFQLAHGGAQDVLAHMAARQMPVADAIVSGIPFSTIEPAARERILRATWRALAPNGVFVVYQYSRKVLPDIERIFGRVEHHVDWRNGVPMQIFRCEKAQPGGQVVAFPMSRA